MAESKKKVFFGSVFDFTESGKDALIHNIRHAFGEDENVPFISYDANNKVFSCELDRTDTTITPGLLAQVKGFIDYAPHKQLGIDEEPHVVPFQGIKIEDQFREEDEPVDQLIDVGDASGDEHDKQDVLQALHNVTAYWSPRNGDISILTTGIAHEIAESEKCQLWPEPAERRVRIVNGCFEEALRKLQNLEPLLVLLAKQRAGDAVKTNANILILPAKVSNPGIEYVLLKLNDISLKRIMTTASAEGVLEQKLVGQLRVWENNEVCTPWNFLSEGISQTMTISRSSVWDRARPFSFGDRKNMEPRFAPSSANPTSFRPAVPSGPVMPHASKYMGPDGVNKITDWNANVDEAGDPDLVPEEPKSEISKPGGRRRIVKRNDSSDESDDEGPPANPRADAHRASKVVSTPRQGALGDSHSATTDLAINVGTTARTAATGSKLAAVPQPELMQSLSADSMANEVVERSVSPLRPARPISSPKLSDFQHTSNALDAPVRSPDLLSNFDSTRYGLHARGKRSSGVRGFAVSNRSHIGINRNQGYSPEAQPSSTVSRGYVRAIQGYPDARAPVYQTSSEHDDTPPSLHFPIRDTTNQSIRPPPGFGLSATEDGPQEKLQEQAQCVRGPSSHNEHLLDETVQDRSTLSAARSAPRPASSDLISLNSGNSKPSAISMKSQGHPPPPKKNYAAMSQQQMATLQQQRQALASPSGRKGPTAQKPSESIEENDEISTRRFHHTMNQQTKNPGRAGRGQKQETKKERAERLAKAKDDAYGPAPPAPPTNRLPPATEPDLNQMSTALKKKLRQTEKLAEIAPKGAADEALLQQTRTLIKELRPLFEAARAFAGTLQFELQVGQVLAGPHPGVKHESVLMPDRWQELFGTTELSTLMPTIFTNMLTSNGADIDRALDTKVKDGDVRLWHHAHPGPSEVLFEFHCQSKSNDEFWLVVNQEGKHWLRKATATVGIVNLHIAASVWDACASLSGQAKWHDPPAIIVDNAKRFVDSLYVDNTKHRIVVYYRPADNSEITIRNLIMKRVSLHNCLQLDRQDFQLRVTEVKTLDVAVHPKDKGLHRACEKLKFEDMISHGQVHYEVSIIHKGMNDVLAQNENLDLGELTDEKTTGRRLLEEERLKHMLGLTTHMVGRIDWMGAQNIGTLPRLIDMANRQLAVLNGSVIGSRIQSSSRVNPSQRVPRGSTMVNGTTGAPVPVHGIRMNTIAEVREEPETGERYLVGLANARVPYLGDPGMSPIGPDDSASQVGGPGRLPLRPKRPADRPLGFW